MRRVKSNGAKGPQTRSLGGLLVKKTTFEVLVFTGFLSGLLLTVLSVSLWRFHSRQLRTWLEVMPASLLPHLVESDYFFVTSKMQLLYSTGLFQAIQVYDPKNNLIVALPAGSSADTSAAPCLLEIFDDAGVSWGTLRYATNFTPALTSIALTLIMVLVGLLSLFMLLRARLSSGLASVLAPFQRLLVEIERLTENLGKTAETTLPYAPQSREEATVNRAIQRLVREIRLREQEIVQYAVDIEQRKSLDELAKVAAQVSHDIRSPLHALRVVQPSLSLLPESVRMILRNAIVRIEDIVNTLAAEKRLRELVVEAHDSEPQPHLLSPLIQSILTEKEVQLIGKPQIAIERIGVDLYPSFAKVVPGEFQRLLSNLIGNAVDAVSEGGLIRVSLAAVEQGFRLTVTDNGPGIDPERLKVLGELGKTFGKAHGTGLGLFHARTHVLSWGGKFRIDSVQGSGTVVTLWFPHCAPLPGFASALSIPREIRTVVVLDDDPSIHAVWRHRFGPWVRSGALSLLHFDSADVFGAWFASQPAAPAVYLMDYELGSSKVSGLDWIESCGLMAQAYLITSHHDEPDIARRCLRLEVGLIPKSVAATVTLIVETPDVPTIDTYPKLSGADPFQYPTPE